MGVTSECHLGLQKHDIVGRTHYVSPAQPRAEGVVLATRVRYLFCGLQIYVMGEKSQNLLPIFFFQSLLPIEQKNVSSPGKLTYDTPQGSIHMNDLTNCQNHRMARIFAYVKSTERKCRGGFRSHTIIRMYCSNAWLGTR